MSKEMKAPSRRWVVTQAFHILLLQLQQQFEIAGVFKLHVDGVLAFLVLQGTVQQNNPVGGGRQDGEKPGGCQSTKTL